MFAIAGDQDLSSRMTSRYVFVSTEANSGVVNPANRELIRSHCMQGKNKKSNSRRSLHAARQATRSLENKPTQAKAPTVGAAAGISASSHCSSGSLKVLARHIDPDNSRATGFESTLGGMQQLPAPNLDCELIRFIHEDTSIYPREFAFNCNAFESIKALVFPVQAHLDFRDIRDTELPLLVQDAPFRHAIRLIISAFTECMQQRPLSAATYMHHRATLSLLTARLSDKSDNLLRDSTIYIINILATMAIWLARHAEVSAHVLALKQMIHLRGGNAFILDKPSFRYYLECFELANCMASGSVSNPVKPYEYIGPRISPPISISMQLLFLDGLVDPRLVSILANLQHVSARIDESWDQRRRLESSAFQQFHGSILSQLLILKDCIKDGMSQCLLFGLLSFITMTVLQVPDNNATRTNKAQLYPYLTQSLRSACRTIEPSSARPNIILFWIFTVGAMSVFNIDDENWLLKRWGDITKSLPGVRLSWEDARADLQRVLWISCIHDRMGIMTYAKLKTKGDRIGLDHDS